MLNPTKEQRDIALLAIEGKYNIVIEAVAGSGKTKECGLLASVLPDKSILVLTFNAKPRDDLRAQLQHYGIKNMQVHTYHSLCTSTGSNDYTDFGIIDTIVDDVELYTNYDVIILDEAQDMTDIYAKLVKKLIVNKPMLCILGDTCQNIYKYKGTDIKYLREPEKHFDTGREWKRVTLSTSFRLTKQVADFVNNCLVKSNRLKAIKSGDVVEYHIMRTYKNVNALVKNIITPTLAKYADLLILFPSDRTQLAVDLQKALADNKRVLVTSIHKAKGLERDAVIIIYFDKIYYRFFPNDDPTICPNELYVAATRTRNKLILIHDYYSEYLDFIDPYILSTYAKIFGGLLQRRKKDEDEKEELTIVEKPTKLRKYNICDFIKHSRTELQYKIVSTLKNSIVNVVPGTNFTSEVLRSGTYEKLGINLLEDIQYDYHDDLVCVYTKDSIIINELILCGIIKYYIITKVTNTLHKRVLINNKYMYEVSDEVLSSIELLFKSVVDGIQVNIDILQLRH